MNFSKAYVLSDFEDEINTLRDKSMAEHIKDFQVDVDGIGTAPGGLDTVIPHALQVEGLTARTGAGYHQVASELIQEGDHRLILVLGETVDTFVSSPECKGRIRREIKTDPVEKGLVILCMTFFNFFP